MEQQQQSHTGGDAPSGTRASESSSTFFDAFFGGGASEVIQHDGGPNGGSPRELGQREESRNHVKGEPEESSSNLVPLPPQPQPRPLLQTPPTATAAAAASTAAVPLDESFFVKHFCAPASSSVLPAKRPAPRNYDDDGDGGHSRAPFPVPVPDWRRLYKRSWCCGQSKESSPPASLCSDSECPRWRCRFHTRNSEGQGSDFSCCTHRPEGKQGCQCHTCKISNKLQKIARPDQAEDGRVRQSGVARAANRKTPTTYAIDFPGVSKSGARADLLSVKSTARASSNNESQAGINAVNTSTSQGFAGIQSGSSSQEAEKNAAMRRSSASPSAAAAAAAAAAAEEAGTTTGGG
ncbi:unnamed protein product, partial [Laminaria digitata]